MPPAGGIFLVLPKETIDFSRQREYNGGDKCNERKEISLMNIKLRTWIVVILTFCLTMAYAYITTFTHGRTAFHLTLYLIVGLIVAGLLMHFLGKKLKGAGKRTLIEIIAMLLWFLLFPLLVRSAVNNILIRFLIIGAGTLVFALIMEIIFNRKIEDAIDDIQEDIQENIEDLQDNIEELTGRKDDDEEEPQQETDSEKA